MNQIVILRICLKCRKTFGTMKENDTDDDYCPSCLENVEAPNEAQKPKKARGRPKKYEHRYRKITIPYEEYKKLKLIESQYYELKKIIEDLYEKKNI